MSAPSIETLLMSGPLSSTTSTRAPRALIAAAIFFKMRSVGWGEGRPRKRAAPSLAVVGLGQRAVERFLHVAHRRHRLRFAGALRELPVRDVFDVLVDPPNVAPRIAHAADAVAERQVGHLGHACRAGGQRTREG